MPLTLTFLTIVAALLIAWAAIRSRHRDRDDRIVLATARARAIYKPALLKVSPVDGAFVGLCFDKGIVALGDGTDDQAWSLYRLESVELLLNGETIALADAASRADPAPSAERVRSLALKVSVDSADQPPYLIRFLEWPAPGLEPSHAVVRDAAASAHEFFQRLAEGMAKAGTSRA